MRKSTSLHLVPSPHLKGRILSALVDHLQNLRQLHPLTSIPLAEWRRRHGLMHPCGCIHRACTRCHQLCGASVMAQYPKAKHWKETTTRTWYFTLSWLPFFFFSRNFLKLQVQWNFKLILSAQMQMGRNPFILLDIHLTDQKQNGNHQGNKQISLTPNRLADFGNVLISHWHSTRMNFTVL